jgi:hypothetical protein
MWSSNVPRESYYVTTWLHQIQPHIVWSPNTTLRVQFHSFLPMMLLPNCKYRKRRWHVRPEGKTRASNDRPVASSSTAAPHGLAFAWQGRGAHRPTHHTTAVAARWSDRCRPCPPDRDRTQLLPRPADRSRAHTVLFQPQKYQNIK